MSRNFCLLRFYYTHLWQSRAQCLNDRPRFFRILFAWKHTIWKLCLLSLKNGKNKDGSKQGNSNPRNTNFSADKIKGKLYLIKKPGKAYATRQKKVLNNLRNYFAKVVFRRQSNWFHRILYRVHFYLHY